MIKFLGAFLMLLLYFVAVKSSFKNSEQFLRKSTNYRFPDFTIILELEFFLQRFNQKRPYGSLLDILSDLQTYLQLEI